MKLKTFAAKAAVETKSEVDKAVYLAYFHLRTADMVEFSTSDVAGWFDGLHFSKPNTSRLASRFTASRSIVRGSKKGVYRLHANCIKTLDAEFPEILEGSEDILFTGAILPEPVFENTRGYLEKLAHQINACYENNLFDGCAVLMRRSIEILLILSFREIGDEASIQDPGGDYDSLSTIINKAKPHTTLNLSKGTRDCIDTFRTLGNFSAHRIEYNCKRKDIKDVALDYRATFEELTYKAGLRK